MTPRCAHPPVGPAAQAAAMHCTSIPVLETERLRLRAPVVADLPHWTALFSGPEAIYLGGPYEDPAAHSWEEFAYYTGCWMLYGHGLWSIERRADKATIGFVHLAIEWDDWEPELGWHLIPDARGQGYAQEAARAARDYGFGLLDTFVSYIATNNLPSNRLAERLGATRDPKAEALIAAREGTGPNVWRHGSRA